MPWTAEKLAGLAPIDTVIQLSRKMILAKNYPGVDVLTARSRLLDENLIGAEDIDLARVVAMVVLHDLVEIDAGDTYAYDDAGYATKVDREKDAADRLFGLLPADQGTYLRGLWEEYEAAGTPDARFANVNPATEEVLGVVADASAAEMHRAIDAARW